ncbi:redoxin domain-containing protein [Prolixibacteraceae bacterium JC049]|nr:redoxin domain-containing protein [Prolixibacteraceae bacterium JC049]
MLRNITSNYSQMKQVFIFIGLLFFATATIAQNKVKTITESDVVTVGQQVPTFNYVDDKGQKQSSTKLQGKVVMYTFFATWCGPCRKELPVIDEKIWKKYQNNDQFKLLVFGREHNAKELKKFKKEHTLNLPLYPDPKREIYSKFAHRFIPRIYLTDKSGKIIFQSKGFNETEFKKLLKTIEENL